MSLARGQFAASSALHNIRISGGFEFAKPIGRFRDWYASAGRQFSIEAAFYTSPGFALVSNLSLSSYPFSGFLGFIDGNHSFLRSTISARVHPLAPIIPLYLQAGAFLARWRMLVDEPG